MARKPTPPTPWRKGQPLTAEHLDEPRRAIVELTNFVANEQLDKPAEDERVATTAGGAASFVSESIEEVEVAVLNSSGTEVGTFTYEKVVSTSVRLNGEIVTFYWE